MVPIKKYTGEEWQELVVSLLQVRYRTSSYLFQEVPDKCGGDLGIEAFSSDGRVYQCYSPEEPISAQLRYEKHRDKLTRDTGKFISNHPEFARLLGNLKVSNYIFIVPIFDN